MKMGTFQNKILFTIRFSGSFFSFSLIKLVLLMALMGIFGIESIAQELTKIEPEIKLPVIEMDLAPPNEHKKNVYVNEEKFIFWPQDKPIFFWLGTSSNENAELFPLLHSGTMNKAGHWESHSKEEVEKYRREGLKLEISSNQFVRWLHFYNKKETTYRFLADGIPPKSKLKFKSKKSFKDKRGFFYSGDVVGNLTATDSNSGVKEIYLSVNGKPFIPAKEIQFPKEGYYLLRHYSVDKVGHTSKILQARFFVDKTPPETELKMLKSSKNIFGPHSILNIPSKDTLSGVKKTLYRWNSELFKNSDNSRVTFNGLKEGPNVLEFYSEDSVSNIEKFNKVTLRFDPIGPTAKSEVKGDSHFEGGKMFLSPRSEIFLYAVDDLVEIKSIEYSLNGLSYGEYSVSFRPPVQIGEFEMKYQAFDVIGNKSKLVSEKFIVDSKSPSTKLLTEGMTYRRGPNVIWVNSKTRIALKSKDDLSGVNSVFYKLDENEESIYNGSFVIPDEGRHTFQYYAFDNVNNKEVVTPVLIVVDDTPPKIQGSFNRTAIRAEKAGESKKINVYPRFTSLVIYAEDNSAKLKEIRFSINGSKNKVYKKALLLEKPGNYSVIVEAEDNLGNISRKKIIFIVTGD